MLDDSGANHVTRHTSHVTRHTYILLIHPATPQLEDSASKDREIQHLKDLLLEVLALPSSRQQRSRALQRNERIALLASAASGKVHLRSDDAAAAAAAAAAEPDASKSEPSLSAQELMVCLTTNI
jgi:hypothetical protein